MRAVLVNTRILINSPTKSPPLVSLFHAPSMEYLIGYSMQERRNRHTNESLAAIADI